MFRQVFEPFGQIDSCKLIKGKLLKILYIEILKTVQNFSRPHGRFF